MRRLVLLFFIISNLVFSQNSKEKDFKYTKAIKASDVIYQNLGKINSSDSIKNKILEGIRLIDKYETKEAEILYAKLLTELSWCEYQKNDFLKAIEIQLNAQKIFEKYKDYDQLATSNFRLGSYYIKIGSEYNNLGSKDERKTAQQVALGYLKQSVKLAETIKNNEKHLQAIGGIANYYVAQKNIDSTIFYSKLMLEKANSDDYKMKVMANNYLGLMSCEKDDYVSAEKYFKNAILNAEKSNAVSLLSAKGNLAYVYMKQKKYKQAKENVFELIETNKKLKKLHNIGKNYATLHDIYKGEKKMDSALYAYDMYYVYRDSVVDQKHKDLIKELNIAYETEKKEAEITILKQKEKIQSFELEKHKQLLAFSVIGLILIMLTSLIVFFYQKKINTIQNLALRSKLTRSQFNPHYINNAFTSLQATLIEHDLDESLINYTSDISRFSRLLLESTFKDEWTLFEEKQMMENYLKTQQHRYENNFEFTISNNFSSDELHQYKLPSALTQTVLENAVEHGGYQNNNGGKIEISIQKMNNEFKIIIKNNKIGDESNSTKKVNNEPSRGLEITKQRMELHQKIHKTKTEFKFEMKENEVLVTFVLPLLNA